MCPVNASSAKQDPKKLIFSILESSLQIIRDMKLVLCVKKLRSKKMSLQT